MRNNRHHLLKKMFEIMNQLQIRLKQAQQRRLDSSTCVCFNDGVCNQHRSCTYQKCIQKRSIANRNWSYLKLNQYATTISKTYKFTQNNFWRQLSPSPLLNQVKTYQTRHTASSCVSRKLHTEQRNNHSRCSVTNCAINAIIVAALSSSAAPLQKTQQLLTSFQNKT